ncbi:Ig-like domain-containing protein [Parabacteroides gordonii]|uniref:Por secretion system C-terminal sorting domain-containing protein n=2 Tax=Parabacteroides TaxID=375288 RepID=A0A0F5JRT7_9BACT|nr:Ig-like domain-containing protein [Parabacteroides gordonii]KKB60340.1 por secretion system C-terminal sorting domain-containing protein [Parabacteroides gordonii MS-1 = DSM 23371]MCA5584295.1 Ig-like domain-containing protein [Parabacteroides gordonii]
MKRVNLLKKMFVLVAFLALAGVGWAMVQEENGPSINSELHTARSGVPVVYGITSLKGNAGDMNVQVKFEIISSEGLDLNKSTFAYYEPNQPTPGWVEGELEDGKIFTFGLPVGFPLRDATSYFKLTPVGSGKLVSKVSVINVANSGEPIAVLNDELTVTGDAKNISITNNGETTYYASLYTAVRFAKENDVINVPNGNYDLRRGTEAITEGSNEAGWYLPINKKGITIKGESREGVKITSSTFASNTAWSTQNLVTVFADDVTLENLTFICKKETNKVIEVVGKNVQLKNITCNPPSGENFAGSIYFNIADLGTASLSNLQLNSGRITFTGATTGTVKMSDVNIDYTNVKIAGSSMEELAAYDPIGSTTGKSGLTINTENVTVKVAANSDAYTLSANTIKNLPANAVLHLAEGTYEVGKQLVVNKPITLEGADAGKVILKAAASWEGSANAQKNLVSVEGNGTGVATLANITIQEAKRSGLNAQSAMTLKLNNVTLKNNTGAGMVVHSAVEVTGLKTEGNQWGGVNLDKGSPSYPISFKFDETSTFAENTKIYADNKELSMTVTYPENQGWYTYDVEAMRIWSNVASMDVTNADELAAALLAIPEGGTIRLSGTITPAATVMIEKAITLCSVDEAKATFNGHLIVKTNDVNIKDLKFTAQSVGFESWEKTAIVLVGSSAKIENCEFEGSVSDDKYVANGINLIPTAAKTNFVITGNTFKNFNQKTADNWTATAVILQDKFTLTKLNGTVSITIPEVTGFDETAIVKNNTFTSCFADYIHMTANKYVYSSTQSADGVADAWLSMDKGTINAPAVTNEAVLTALNATDKPALTDKAIAIRCSDAWLVTNESLAGNDLPVLVFTMDGGDYKAEKKTYAPTIDNSKLTASTIEAEQTLSASILSGGKATVTTGDKTIEIAGTFAWEDPTTVAKEGEQSYPVVFTPADLSTYSAAKTTYTFSGTKAIKQYYTVTTGKCENGSVEIKEANAANRYLKGSKLTLVYHPDANYKTNADAATTLSVTEKQEITTIFEPIMHTVTIAAGENGSVSVNGITYSGSSNTISVQQGSELAVQAIPVAEYVGSLTCSDSKVISNGVVTVDKPFTVTASFTAKLEDQFVVSVPAVQNGKILLYDKDGNAINAGSSVETGTDVSVLAVPDLGYKLTSDGIKNNGSSITGGKIKVSAAVSITAAFEKQTFAVKTTGNNATITLALAVEKAGTLNLDQVEYGTKLTASVAPAAGYKLLSLVVNGKEIANGGTFTVTAATEVKAVMCKLATIVIDKTPQTFVYDGNKKEFVVKTIPAGIGDFTVTYDAVPQDAAGYDKKAYKVIITRDADDVYAAVSQEIEGGLVILAADMKGVAIPTASSGNLESNPNSDLGSYAWENGSVGNDAPIHNAIFTPTSKNFKKSTFSILTGKGTKPAEVTLDWGGLQTRSTSPNVKFTVNGGSLAVLNGSAVLSSGTTLYAGQKIRLVATPDAAHAAKVTWSVTNGTLSDQTDTEATLTLAEGSITVSATFAAKSSPVFPGLDGLDKSVYDGTIYGTGTPAIKGGTGAVTDNWSIAFKQGGVATSTPINAGTYDIYVSRPADAIYSAVIDQNVGSFTIAQKQATAEVPVATPILKGQSLAQSVLSGTADVDGSFVWIDPTVQMTETGNQKAKFVPANANYRESEVLTTNVTVTKAEGVTLRTLNVNITNPEKGTVTMTLNGSEVVAGASVTKGDKLIVTYVATAANYKPSATIGGSDYKSGAEYIVPESGNVEVAVSFVFNNPNPGTDPDPDPSTVDVTGITLEPTSKTLAVNETFALKATVAPADATDTGVSWSSSAPDIVSVDTKGNVKALKAGTATITATTNDGGFTATCKISVSVPTGIEDILSGPRVYAQDGSIVLEPAMTIQVLVSDMTGRVIWQGKLSEKKQMAVSAGVYIVRLSNANGVQTQKVIVQ